MPGSPTARVFSQSQGRFVPDPNPPPEEVVCCPFCLETFVARLAGGHLLFFHRADLDAAAGIIQNWEDSRRAGPSPSGD